MPYSTGCKTPLSNFEAGLNYKDVSDPAVMVSFPLRDDPDGASLVAWTTTPWTLPSNLALCINPTFTYCKVPHSLRPPCCAAPSGPPCTLFRTRPWLPAISCQHQTPCLLGHVLAGCATLFPSLCPSSPALPRPSALLSFGPPPALPRPSALLSFGPLCPALPWPSALLQVRNRDTGAVLVVAESRLGVLPSLPKASSKGKQQPGASVAEPGAGSEAPVAGAGAEAQALGGAKVSATGPGTTPQRRARRGQREKEKREHEKGSGPGPGPQLDPGAYELLGTVTGEELAGKRCGRLAAPFSPLCLPVTGVLPPSLPRAWLCLPGQGQLVLGLGLAAGMGWDGGWPERMLRLRLCHACGPQPLRLTEAS